MPDKGRRVRLAAPAAACVLAAVGLVVASLAAYGAAEGVGYPDWASTAGGLIFALPLLALSLWALGDMWRETAEDYNVDRTRFLLGAVVFLLASGLLVAYIVSAGRASSYEGEFSPEKGRYDPLFNLGSFLVASVIATAVIVFFLHLAREKLYLASIDHQRDRVEGPDPVGTLMRT